MSTNSELQPLTKYESYVIEQWNREEIILANYNPRLIDDDSRKALSANLKKIGLIEPLVVNRATKRLVSGHQRIQDLDRKHKGINYSLHVAVIELDEKTEMEQNLFMNNPSVQGYFDFDKIIEMSSSIDIANAGFINESDMEMLKINLDLGEMNIQKTEEIINSYENIKQENNAANKAAPDYQERKDAIKELKKNVVAQNEYPGYVTVSFSNFEAKKEFMERFGYDPYFTVIKGEDFLLKL